MSDGAEGLSYGEYKTTISNWLNSNRSVPVESTKFGGKRYFAKGVGHKVAAFRKRGFKNLGHDISTGYHDSSSGMAQYLSFSNKAVSEASSDDFLALHEITDDTFTMRIDVEQSSFIKTIEYSPERLLMRVTFIPKGSIVLYDHVPASVPFELEYVAKSGGSVGGRFWDLVRKGLRGGLLVGGPYVPKVSTFERMDSKYPFTSLHEGYTRLPIVDGKKIDPNRRGMQYKRNVRDEDTGELLRETKRESEKRINRKVDAQIQAALDRAKGVVEEKVQRELERSARLKRQRSGMADQEQRREIVIQLEEASADQRYRPPSFLGFRRNYLVD